MFEIEMYRVDGKQRLKIGRVEWWPDGVHNCLLYVEGLAGARPVSAREPSDGVRQLLDCWFATPGGG